MIEAENALIGHSGLVGSTLARASHYAACYNSRTIDDMRGGRFGHIVCAGVSAVKWLANKEPEKDLAGIRRLTDVLDTVRADRFTLISTVDVFADPVGVDESTSPAGNPAPYGRHRFELEQWVASRFPACRIVRLPGLFGTGLKKNILFDLIHDNGIEGISLDSCFQWYPLRRLADDLARIEAEGRDLVHIAPEPLPTRDIVMRHFPEKAYRLKGDARVRYDFRTLHPDLLGGGHGPYQLSAATVMDELGHFIAESRAA
ncbi:Rossmann-fold NAD(P)-binding domain-containing protein [Rhizorhabdus sp. FW153]|uniref:hypothetical protein n=1 Tax=Rhizorhabdus sp. FW153 TaxID=3400216 RepID=UPI003CE8ADF7